MRISTTIILVLFISCTQELDIALPTAPPQLALNSLLHPDSIIRVSLTTTLSSSVNSTDFPIVDDALVQLYENDELLSDLTFQDSVYVLDYYPKAAQKYSVVATAPGYPVVRASDIMPPPPNVTICTQEDTADRYPYRNGIMNVTIHDSPLGNDFYWFHNVSYSYVVDSCFWNLNKRERDCVFEEPLRLAGSSTGYYYSYSPVPDRFNAYVDNTIGGVTTFEFYIRVDDITQNGEDITFELASGHGFPSKEEFFREDFHESSYSTLYTTNASQHYDRYLKSSITYSLNRSYNEDEDLGFKPFVQFSQVYSNVENGIGIFAAYNTTDLDIGSYPCE
ncbi:DUF4249 domain-containing protein [Tunicatimonas pelagia]|uniref:DUF4249 domain-containing protein n=1 Tax=Tunicatimonas pelagia TaxID=931531 RepID=UPI0026658BEE|nr:DUF4249 domain-containing protein [Tunicatimonas pelagia]WKN44734.1 DUF4249 domain-containing protein [Tunicatimonas pelagia]